MQRRYRRFFVILEGEDTTFEKSKLGGLKGYAKVEISNEKGTMALYCQNLKSTEGKDMRYRWYLINAKGDKEPNIVDIGPMEIDGNGKGEMQWEFNAENVKASGEAIDQFNLLVLLAETIGQNKVLEAPLVGYIDKEKINWKSMIEGKLFGSFKKSESAVSFNEKAKGNETTSIKVEETIQEKEEPEKKPVIGAKEPVDKESSKEEIEESTPQASYSFEEDKLESETIAEPNKSESFDNTYKKEEPANDPFGEKNLLKSLQGYIESTLKMFPKVNPFDNNLAGYQWWQIYYNYQTIYRSYMPFIAYIEGINQTSNYYPYQQPSEYHRQIYLYQHYIFGIVYDQENIAKYYVYGIPGRKINQEQPYKGSTGFTYWHPCRVESNDNNASGYWLLHIDVKTGKVATPLAKTEI
ncbi:hypothetical protein [Alkaliphilus peptidifermentans]|uniref:Uncharacterized protein n=1 Tax=Alkaliphilus peptidifermentans DSM 18978 TaxID=1120976 RepID=A0A1G5AN01_9FIRM|nr:hypothetical protein [Alkaliphilus peptidifermentans]SCX79225.1 hypothetical protein SAMN03080606_00214 [Alkaliphilus peptidifermentans DSM 18978]